MVQKRTITKKNDVLLALAQTRGMIYKACEVVGISAETYYRWLREDPEFADKAQTITELALDHVETKLQELIDKGNVNAIIFYLKTKGKKRGYIEKTEIDSRNINLNVDTEVDEKLKELLRKIRDGTNQ